MGLHWSRRMTQKETMRHSLPPPSDRDLQRHPLQFCGLVRLGVRRPRARQVDKLRVLEYTSAASRLKPAPFLCPF